MSVTVRAPAVVKLLGEHAVLYGSPSLAATLSMHASASADRVGGAKLAIVLRSFGGFRQDFDRASLEGLADSYSRRKGIGDYLERSRSVDPRVLPYATIAARLAAERGIDTSGLSVSISSAIPVQKGYASSAACSVAFAMAILREAGLSLPDKEAIDIARDGERVVHMSENAGGIDVSTSYYGGYVSYSAGNGASREAIKKSIDMLLVDTGPKASTAEMVGRVAALLDSRRDYAERLLGTIGDCAASGISALKAGDMESLGSCMFRTHEALAGLGVSSEGLDRFVGLARRGGLYGAKLSGGGGGGLAIAIGPGRDSMLAVARAAGMEAAISSVSGTGAKDFYAGKTE